MAIAMKPWLDGLRIHRSWEDWTGIGLGVLVVISPWSTGPLDIYIALNAVIVGLLICSMSTLELRAIRPYQEWVNVGLGLLLAASPWLLNYSQRADLAITHYVLGAVVAVLAAFECWQGGRQQTPTG